MASGKSEMALAWSGWRWVMITVFTVDGSMPFARSCAAAACSALMSMSR